MKNLKLWLNKTCLKRNHVNESFPAGILLEILKLLLREKLTESSRIQRGICRLKRRWLESEFRRAIR